MPWAQYATDSDGAWCANAHYKRADNDATWSPGVEEYYQLNWQEVDEAWDRWELNPSLMKWLAGRLADNLERRGFFNIIRVEKKQLKTQLQSSRKLNQAVENWFTNLFGKTGVSQLAQPTAGRREQIETWGAVLENYGEAKGVSDDDPKVQEAATKALQMVIKGRDPSKRPRSAEGAAILTAKPDARKRARSAPRATEWVPKASRTTSSGGASSSSAPPKATGPSATLAVAAPAPKAPVTVNRCGVTDVRLKDQAADDRRPAERTQGGITYAKDMAYYQRNKDEVRYERGFDEWRAPPCRKHEPGIFNMDWECYYCRRGLWRTLWGIR